MRCFFLAVACAAAALPASAGFFAGVEFPGTLHDVSGDGLVAVGTGPTPSDANTPWRIAGGQLELLTPPDAGGVTFSTLERLRLDYDGSVIWASSSFAADGRIYRWRESTGVFAVAAFGYAQMVAVSDDGETAVSTARSNPSTHPTIYLPDGTRLKIVDPNWPQGGYAVSISGDGQTMTGRWWGGPAFTYSLSAGFVPEPSGVLLALVGLIVAGARRRGPA